MTMQQDQADRPNMPGLATLPKLARRPKLRT